MGNIFAKTVETVCIAMEVNLVLWMIQNTVHIEPLNYPPTRDMDWKELEKHNKYRVIDAPTVKIHSGFALELDNKHLPVGCPCETCKAMRSEFQPI